MTTLFIENPSGLYQELYVPDTMSSTDFIVEKTTKQIKPGAIFWNRLFSREKLNDVIDSLKKNVGINQSNFRKFNAVLMNSSLFIENTIKAKENICDQGNDERLFFRYLETLSIACELYSKFIYAPMHLTINEGFELPDFSMQILMEQSMNTKENPYFDLATEMVEKICASQLPNIVFFQGKIGYFSVAAARLLRTKNQKMHISVTRHASEYYSLNKIIPYLMKNTLLFSVFDSVILEHCIETEQQLEETLRWGYDIRSVPNILYKAENGIVKTDLSIPAGKNKMVIANRPKQRDGLMISPATVYNIHLNPAIKCYWNKCSFCGINKKYFFDSDIPVSLNCFTEKAKELCDVIPSGSNLWFIDEAIHPTILRQIANVLHASNSHFSWQARCRIDAELLENNLPEKLAAAGLREMRLGLESASYRILNLMNKTNDKNYLKIAEDVTRLYTANGIHIHFPVIIGFPSETKADRQKTYEFLTKMQNLYDKCTFNINILNLDVSSRLFRHQTNYGIKHAKLLCPEEFFLGNFAHWEGTDKDAYQKLCRERDVFMLNNLYPWMPANTFLAPSILYRLSETIRNTLLWRRSKGKGISFVEKNGLLKLSSNMVYFRKNATHIVIYNWDTHHSVECDDMLVKLIKTWEIARSVAQGIDEFNRGQPQFDRKEIINLITKLAERGFLMPA